MAEAPAGTTTGHADARLLAVYERWLGAYRAYLVTPVDQGDEKDTADWERIWAEEREIEELPARTAAGLAAKLRVAFHGHALTDPGEAEAFVRRGEVAEGTLTGDHLHSLLWSVVRDVDRVAASAPAALVSPGVCRIVPAGAIEDLRRACDRLLPKVGGLRRRGSESAPSSSSRPPGPDRTGAAGAPCHPSVLR